MSQPKAYAVFVEGKQFTKDLLSLAAADICAETYNKYNYIDVEVRCMLLRYFIVSYNYRANDVNGSGYFNVTADSYPARWEILKRVCGFLKAENAHVVITNIIELNKEDYDKFVEEEPEND